MNKIISADWTLEQIAIANNDLNKGYFVTGEYAKKPEYIKLKEAFEYILQNDSIRPLNILDVGCGSGWHALYFNKEGITKDLIFNGIDISIHMCNNAKKNYPNGIFFVENIEKKSFNNEYDVVFESGVIEIMKDWRSGLINMLRSSKKWFIAHRLFFVENYTKTTQVKTYLDLPDIRHEIGLKDLNEVLEQEGWVIEKQDVWYKGSYQMGTFIMRRK